MDRLEGLEGQSIFILREGGNRLNPLAMLWSVGKDSNALLWLARKAFFGRVPFPVILLDTGNEFPEVYTFRDRLIAEWGLTYIDAPCPALEETDPSFQSKPRDAAGSWDFRHQPAEFWDQYNAEAPPGGHVRVHPLLAWTELDVWRYIE